MAIGSSTQPSLKARFLSRFPARLLAGAGITITKEGSLYTIAATDPPEVVVPENQGRHVLHMVITGAPITTGIKGDLFIPYNCTILSAVLLADSQGDISIDIWKEVIGDYPPLDAGSITASEPLALTDESAVRNQTLTGWDTALLEGDTLRVNVDSVDGVLTRVTLALEVQAASA